MSWRRIEQPQCTIRTAIAKGVHQLPLGHTNSTTNNNNSTTATRASTRDHRPLLCAEAGWFAKDVLSRPVIEDMGMEDMGMLARKYRPI
jgi:hypothetical protein